MRTLPTNPATPLPYPPRVSLAQTPSPFHPLLRFAEWAGHPRLWIKRDDLTGIELTGNKSRKLEYLIADARSEGADTLVTYGGVQSNHCRATAAIGARAGMRVQLLIRGDAPETAPDGNLLLDHLFGAKVAHYPSKDFVARQKEIIEETLAGLRRQGRAPYYFPVGGSVPIALWGYVRCLEELRAQAAESRVAPRHIITACGSGGTAAGLILGRALLEWRDLTVWAVAVTETELYWKNEIRRLLRETCDRFGLPLSESDLPVHVTDEFVGPGYAIPYDGEIEVIREMARREGILLDPVYTGKAMYGLVNLIRQGRIAREEPVVFLHTGGVFGLFAYKEILV